MKKYSPEFLKKLAQKIVNSEWITVIERPGSPVLDWDGNIPFVNHYFPQLTQIPVSFSGFMFFKNKLMVKKDDYEKVSKYIAEIYEKNPNILKRLAKKAEDDCDFIRMVSSNLKNNQLNAAMNIIDLYSRIIHHFRWVFNASEFLEKRVRENMEKPIKDNFITKYNLRLDNIRSEINRNESLKNALQKKNLTSIRKYPIIFKEITEFVHEFSWIKVFHHQGDLLTFRDFMNEISQTLDIIQAPQKKFSIIQDINLLRHVIFLRTHIAESLNSYSTAMIKPALQKLAEDSRLKYEEIAFLTVGELKKLALTRELPVSKNALKKRISGGYACINLERNYYFISGKNLQDLYKIYDELKKEKTGISQVLGIRNELKGQTANRGFVRGLARIVTNVNEFDKLQKGDILVANATTPNYLPIMAKAAAYLTDEGGITSHAAIVSRELRKPCITGLKNATKLLKDGDLVEVDARNGIVRIIKKAS